MTTNNTSRTKSDEAQAEARHVAQRAGASASRVGSAARSAGKRVSDVAGEELSNLRADLSDLISRISSLSEAEVEEAKERLLEKIAAGRETASELVNDARNQFEHGVECSRDYVKEHPIQSVGYAALTGLLLGLLIARR
ncbi:YqjD family protein [Nitrosovibrio sp. Nv17]|jgi:ElaB/YqjD/DUF883 family membrane-anchored ribosome-binding protein|uniref:DUF883 family protein n=1 Tax=Nitrosovibrio sp. Nv17 TaxID=1855339 RepID=UPI000908CB45|nr:DUF883 family protein [Nitrosovibrio sp. Nv17]SFW18094.1 Membrane-anchored ribosome-binding protein, inhibits growth in stationary phase, ElaB/YqjD/DUF883 family [Nitrosovibrio sp. Nv17]